MTVTGKTMKENLHDVKFNSSGILFDSNMFHENIETLLNNFYSKRLQQF